VKRLAFALAALAIACKSDPPAAQPIDASASEASAMEAVVVQPPSEPEASAPRPVAAAASPQYPRLAATAPDPVKYPTPTDEDWRGTLRVDLERNDDACFAHTYRGWLRLTCGVAAGAGASVLGGTRDGLYLAAKNGEVTITAPLRRGDRRVVQITVARGTTTYDSRNGGMFEVEPVIVQTWGIVSIAWIDTPGPVVTIDRTRVSLGY
jgi:hypothetical protein